MSKEIKIPGCEEWNTFRCRHKGCLFVAKMDSVFCFQHEDEEKESEIIDPAYVVMSGAEEAVDRAWELNR